MTKVNFFSLFFLSFCSFFSNELLGQNRCLHLTGKEPAKAFTNAVSTNPEDNQTMIDNTAIETGKINESNKQQAYKPQMEKRKIIPLRVFLASSHIDIAAIIGLIDVTSERLAQYNIKLQIIENISVIPKINFEADTAKIRQYEAHTAKFDPNSLGVRSTNDVVTLVFIDEFKVGSSLGGYSFDEKMTTDGSKVILMFDNKPLILAHELMHIFHLKHTFEELQHSYNPTAFFDFSDELLTKLKIYRDELLHTIRSNPNFYVENDAIIRPYYEAYCKKMGVKPLAHIPPIPTGNLMSYYFQGFDLTDYQVSKMKKSLKKMNLMNLKIETHLKEVLTTEDNVVAEATMHNTDIVVFAVFDVKSYWSNRLRDELNILLAACKIPCLFVEMNAENYESDEYAKVSQQDSSMRNIEGESHLNEILNQLLARNLLDFKRNLFPSFVIFKMKELENQGNLIDEFFIFKGYQTPDKYEYLFRNHQNR